MKAKFLTLLAAAIIASGSLFAQEKKQAPTPEQIIEKRTERMQKKLELDDATAAKFAPIYKDYLKAKAECRSNCKKCKNPTEEQIKENISKRLETQEKAAKVEKKYYKKLSSILTGKQLQQVFCKDKQQPKFGKNNKNGKNGKQAPRFNKQRRGAKHPMMKGKFHGFNGKAPKFAPGFPIKDGKAPKFAPGCPMKDGKRPKFAPGCPKKDGKCPKFAPGCPKKDGKCPKNTPACPKENAPAETPAK